MNPDNIEELRRLKKIDYERNINMYNNSKYMLDSETGLYTYIGPPIQIVNESTSSQQSAIDLNRPSGSRIFSQKEIITTDNIPSTSRIIWSRATIIDLISVYKEKKMLFGTGLLKSDEIWNQIHTLMITYGHTMSKTQCKDKFTNLKRMYHKKCDNDRRTGAGPMDFEYFEEFQQLFSNDQSSNPTAVSSSMIPNLISAQPPAHTQTVSNYIKLC